MSPSNPDRPRVSLARLFALVGLLLVAIGPRVAWAYPGMIRHGYTGCAECHQDPAGGGALTEYGRAQSEVLLPTVWKHREGQEPGDEKDFLFGWVGLPEAVTLQADSRSLLIPEPSNFRFIQMQTDLRGQVEVGKVRGYASVGWVSEGARMARVFDTGSTGAVVSREHWIGVEAADGVLVRAGSFTVPYGLRTEEHRLFAQDMLRSNINDSQPLGLGVFAQRGRLRGEVMGIAGDFQVRPDVFRERGVSAMGAWAPSSKAEVGVSGLFTHANLDVDLLEERTRRALGVFGRVSPVEPLVFLGQGDVLLDTVGGHPRNGATAYLQADWEVVQGAHVKATGEWCDDDFSDGASVPVTGWLTGQWFLLPRVDVRLDALRGTLYCSPGTAPQTMGLAQLHFFL